MTAWEQVRAIYEARVDLSARDVAVLLAMVRYAGPDGLIYVSAETLAAATRYEERAVRRARQRLIAIGVLVPVVPHRPVPGRAVVLRLDVDALSRGPEPDTGSGSAAEAPEPNRTQDPDEPDTESGSENSNRTQDPVEPDTESDYLPCPPRHMSLPPEETMVRRLVLTPPPLTEPEALAPHADRDRVIGAWIRAYRQRDADFGGRAPGRPRSDDPAKAPGRDVVTRALRSHSVDSLELVVDWAFGSPDYHARHLRGETGEAGDVYLGLANLLAPTKLAAKLEKATAWQDRGRPGRQPIVRGRYVGAEAVDEDAWRTFVNNQ